MQETIPRQILFEDLDLDLVEELCQSSICWKCRSSARAGAGACRVSLVRLDGKGRESGEIA